jgi:hypothetical protein
MVRAFLTAVTALALAPAASAAVAAYPSSQTIPASGPLPQDGASAVTLSTGIGERDGAWIVVTGATNVAVRVDGSNLGPLKASVSFGHFVAFGSRAVPDALLPWDGSTHPVEKPNQPLYREATARSSTSRRTAGRPTSQSRSTCSRCTSPRRTRSTATS